MKTMGVVEELGLVSGWLRQGGACGREVFLGGTKKPGSRVGEPGLGRGRVVVGYSSRSLRALMRWKCLRFFCGEGGGLF